MADFMSGIRQIPPTFPVKPAQPAKRDEERRNPRRPLPEPEEDRKQSDDDEPGHLIDEHV